MQKRGSMEYLVLLCVAIFFVSIMPALAENPLSNFSSGYSESSYLSSHELSWTPHYDPNTIPMRFTQEHGNRSIRSALDTRIPSFNESENNSIAHSTMNAAASAFVSLEWQKCLGGSDWDDAYSIQQTTDGGYIVAGGPESNDGDVSGNHGFDDYWVVKLSSSGTLEWQKCLGGSDLDNAQSIQETTDGGYIVAGFTNSNDGDVSGNHGGFDSWVVKLSSSGALEWQKCLGGIGFEWAQSIHQSTDGGYIVAGLTNSNDGDVSGNHGESDYWVVKLSSSGALEWQKCLGGSDWDNAYSIQQTTDGGYIVAGKTSSNDGDVSGNHGESDSWVVKLSSSGALEWQKCLGGSDWDNAYSIQQTTDEGYIVAGSANSNDGDVSGNHGESDYWVVKLSSSGSLEWQKCLGGSGSEGASSIQQTTDEGYIVAGSANSNDGDVSGNHGESDYWVVKLSSSGSLEWQKCLGGSGSEGASSIQQTTDEGYIVAGSANSNDGDVSGNHGEYDSWVVKLAPEADYQWNCLGGYLTSSPSMIQDVEGRIHVFVRGGDNTLWDSVDGTWAGLGGYITSDPYAVIDDDGQIHIFVQGSDGALWDRMLDGDWVPLGGGIASNPCAVLLPEGDHLKIAVKGEDDALWINDFDTETLTGTWSYFGGEITSNPYVIFDALGIMHVFVRGSDGALYENADGSWLGHGGYITSDAIPAFDSESALCTFVRGGDGALWEFVDGTGWVGLGGYIAPADGSFYKANSALVAGSSGDLQAFVCAGDNSLWFNMQGEWHPIGGVLSSDSSAIFDEETGLVHVAARGSDGQLWICTTA